MAMHYNDNQIKPLSLPPNPVVYPYARLPDGLTALAISRYPVSPTPQFAGVLFTQVPHVAVCPIRQARRAGRRRVNTKQSSH